jgi:hypothetical protein
MKDSSINDTPMLEAEQENPRTVNIEMTDAPAELVRKGTVGQQTIV